MKEKAISFCRRLIPRIYADEKTHTRRVAKPQPQISDLIKYRFDGFEDEDYGGDGEAYLEELSYYGEPTERYISIGRPCFYPGDILWVKEEYYEYGHWVDNGVTKSGKRKRKFVPVGNAPIYYYDNLPKDVVVLKNRFSENTGYFWRNSRFMPRRAARLFLRLKEVSAQRIKDITLEDMIKEGITAINEYQGRKDFSDLWDKLNKKRGYGWFDNPFVFVYIFKRLKYYG